MADTKKYLHNLDVVNNKVINLLLNPLTTAQRTTIGGTLGATDEGYVCFDITLNQQYFWDGSAWIVVGGSATWGSITGTLTAQTDLTSYLSSNYYPLLTNPANYLTSSALTPYLTSATAAATYQPLLTNPVTGTGTATRVAFWDTGSSISSDADLYWDNTLKRLGIGTTTPTTKLEVDYGTGAGPGVTIVGGANVFENVALRLWDKGTAALNRNVLEFGHVNASVAYAPGARILSTNVSGLMTTGAKLILETTSNDLSTWNTNQLVLSNNGNVGIGTASPNSTLDVNGWINAVSGLVLNGSGWNSGVPSSGGKITFTSNGIKYSPEGGAGFHHTFFTNGFSRLYINDTGVGIQNTNPLYKLEVGGTTTIDAYSADTGLVKINSGFTTPSAPNLTATALLIKPSYNFSANPLPPLSPTPPTGNKVIGILYNPTINAMTNTQHIAFQNVSGDNYFNSTFDSSINPPIGGYGKTTFFDQDIEIAKNPTGYPGYNRIYPGPPLFIGGSTTHSDTAKAYLTLGVLGGNNMAANTVLIKNLLGDVSQSATGTYTNTQISGRVLSISGNAEYKFLDILPSYDSNQQVTTYTGAIRGVYYKLTESTILPAGAKNIAWENFNGDIIHGNLAFTGGGPDKMVTVDTTGKLKTAPVPTGGNSPLTTAGDLYIYDTADARLGIGGNGQVLTVDTSLTSKLKWATFTGGGGARITAIVTANVTGGTAAGTDYVYLVNQTTLVTVTLPPASGNTNSYTIKKIGTGQVNIATTAGNIDGSSSPITINVQNVSITLVTDGTNWFII